MTRTATIDGESPRRKTADRAGMLCGGRVARLLRSLLAGTRLLQSAVRSLFRRPDDVFPDHLQKTISFLLLKPTQALMLAGIRCAGAGGGGPGH